jgi:hypothetical protein
LHGEFAQIGRAARDALENQLALGLGQQHGGRVGGIAAKALEQPPVGFPRHQKAAPAANGRLHRGQPAAHDDGRGDHHAAGAFLLDHQPGAHAQDGNLQEEAQRLGHRGHVAGPIAGQALQAEAQVVAFAPQHGEAGQHAHGADRLGIARRNLGKLGAGGHLLAGLGKGLAGVTLVPEGQQEQQHAARQRHMAEHGVKQVDQADVDRHPRRIEQAQDVRAGQEVAQLVEITQGLAAAPGGERAHEDEARQLRIKARPKPHQQPGTHHFEGRQCGQAGTGEEREVKQGRAAARSQYPVVHLHHVDR